METLCYQTLPDQNAFILRTGTERFLQFGEGNFLRGFVDYFIDCANERMGLDNKVIVVQPIKSGLADVINRQDGLYHLYLRGGEPSAPQVQSRLVSSISRAIDPYRDFEAFLACAEQPELRFIVSNTTEAGISCRTEDRLEDCPSASFPGKLTQLLWKRYQCFGQQKGKGFIVLSCELIDHNGQELKKCVQTYAGRWGLPEDFLNWLEEENVFCDTLVDRIITGYPKEDAERLNQENGVEDRLLDTGEPFAFWAIQGPEWMKQELPFEQAGLPVVIVPDSSYYKKRKVRILNGAHTGFVLGAYLAGLDIVRDCMHNDSIRGFMNKMLYEEVIPTLPLDKKDLEEFAAAVQDRFNNPFVDHELMSISLNSTSKWKARNLPSLLEYVEKTGRLPECLSMSLAAYIAFYTSDVQELTEAGLVCRRAKGNTYICSDDRWALEFYWAHKDDSAADLVHAVLTNRQMWDQDLTEIAGLEAAVLAGLTKIRAEGAEAAFASCL